MTLKLDADGVPADWPWLGMDMVAVKTVGVPPTVML